MAKKKKTINTAEVEKALSSEESELRPITMAKPVLAFMFKTAWREKKKLYGIYLLRYLGLILGDLKVILLPKLLVDQIVLLQEKGAASEHLRMITIYVAITLAADFLGNFINDIANSTSGYLSTWFDQYFKVRLGEKAMEMDFEHTEDPKVLDEMNRAKEGISWYSGGVVGILDCVFELIYNVFLCLTVITIIAIYCPLLIPVQLLGMGLVTYFRMLNQKINMEFFGKLAKSNRLFSYMFYEIVAPYYGKDIRLYDGTAMMCKRIDEYGSSQIALWRRQRARQVKNDYGSNIANAVRDAISYFYMGYRALAGAITLGEFSMCVASASKLYRSLMSIGENAQNTLQKCAYAYRFLKFLDYPDAFEKGDKPVKAGEHVIEFRDVSFKYPRSEEYVLEHISLRIESGEHLSIVGLNGAGKTTFIKLLCRLYAATEGEILIDGVNILDYSEEEYRKLFAVVFQDFNLFAFSLKENVAMGNTDLAADEAHVTESLQLSGLYDDAVKLDKGLDTLLFKSFDEHGTELSGGQKQKAAISRALYRNAPIVILDEPTAALDPMAEYEIYKSFDLLVGNKSAIYISHRLSSCKFCDKIAVFAEKTVKEYGTHSELIKIVGGIYAEMFTAQAQYYVENS